MALVSLNPGNWSSSVRTDEKHFTLYILCIYDAGSIPDGVTGIFHLHNPSGRTMAFGLIQPLTEMSTRN
jgi:hypothetical protein